MCHYSLIKKYFAYILNRKLLVFKIFSLKINKIFKENISTLLYIVSRDGRERIFELYTRQTQLHF